MPAQAELRLTRPGCELHLSDEAYIEEVQEALHAKELELGREQRASGKAFTGKEAVLRQRPMNRPKTVEPRRQLNPRVASVNRWRRVEALQRLKSFLNAYREAWCQWRDGIRDVLFPAGTYALRIYAGAKCCEFR